MGILQIDHVQNPKLHIVELLDLVDLERLLGHIMICGGSSNVWVTLDSCHSNGFLIL
jgi:hypothetical protein